MLAIGCEVTVKYARGRVLYLELHCSNQLR